MKKLQPDLSRKLVQIAWVLGALILSFGSGYFVAIAETEGIIRFLQFVALIAIALLILRYPYWGVIVIVASLPILDIVPDIPLGSSAVSLLGGVTLGAYFLSRAAHGRKGTNWSPSLIWGGLFIFWIIVSNPSAALLPDADGRNWAFTFIQLWLLSWLAAQLLDMPSRHRALIWAFSMAVLISAGYALTQGYIGESIRLSERAEGLAGGANSAARYFVVGLVFIVYLRTVAKKTLLNLLLLLGLGLVIFAALSTVSRTGLLLLFASIGLLFIQRLGGKYQLQALIVLFLAGLVIWLFADNILAIMGTITTSVREGGDTVGVRYGLWRAGWRMWLDYPLQGVGIGQYSEKLPVYGSDLLAPRYWILGAHNMYVQVLAETGLVGIVIFMAMLISSLREMWRLRNSDNSTIVALFQTWFVVFVIMLLGGLTKHDHYDKLIWITIGLGASLPTKNSNS